MSNALRDGLSRRRAISGLLGAGLLSHIVWEPKLANAQLSQTVAAAPFYVARQGGKSVWLLGGFHALRAEDVWFSRPMSAALAGASSVFLESKPEKNFFEQVDFVNITGQPRAQRMKRAITGACRDRYYPVQKAFMLDGTRAEEMRPQFAAVMINSAYLGRHHGFRTEFGMEKTVLSRAAPKAIKYLEDTNATARAFAHAEASAEVEYFCSTLDRLSDHAQFVGSYVDAWMSGDVAQLKSMEDASPNEFEYNALGIRQHLIVERQAKWFQKILGELETIDTVFVAVGLQHVIPDDGLLSMFAKKGFKVTRILD